MHLSKVSNFAFLGSKPTSHSVLLQSSFPHTQTMQGLGVARVKKQGFEKTREREIRTLKHLKKKPSTTIHQICMQLLQAFNAFHLHQAPPPFACLFLLWMESIVKSNFSGPPTKKFKNSKGAWTVQFFSSLNNLSKFKLGTLLSRLLGLFVIYSSVHHPY